MKPVFSGLKRLLEWMISILSKKKKNGNNLRYTRLYLTVIQLILKIFQKQCQDS